jgi:hypothetical protein
MKKVKTITIPGVAAHTKEVEVFICDTCGVERKSVASCTLCGRHVCKGYVPYCAKFDPHDWGDYPCVYCPICYDLRFIKYEKEYLAMEQEFEKRQEVWLQKIKEESLAYDK